LRSRKIFPLTKTKTCASYQKKVFKAVLEDKKFCSVKTIIFLSFQNFFRADNQEQIKSYRRKNLFTFKILFVVSWINKKRKIKVLYSIRFKQRSFFSYNSNYESRETNATITFSNATFIN
jgi:hypothetical protein